MKAGAIAFCAVGVLSACSSHSSGGSTPGSTAPTEASSPTPASSSGSTVAPTPTVTSVAGVKAPVTPTQLAASFGTSLSGPQASNNGQPTFLYKQPNSSTPLVVSVTIYTPQILAQRNTTPDEYYSQYDDPTAEHVSGIGKKAVVVQDSIYVLTNHDDVLIVAANQQVREEQLKDAASKAAAKL